MTCNLQIINGDCRTELAKLPDESVQCVVTSPPYWGLRDYGHADQIGLEASPEDYVLSVLSVFVEIQRVLRSDGTCWLNLGDSYSGSGKGGNPESGKQATNKGSQTVGTLYGKTGESARHAAVTNVSRRACSELGLKPKNLIGIPWRVALALQDDGWYLRSDIIWAKPNPMPESVTDRPTRSHEYIFLLTKSERYFYDAEAIKEKSVCPDPRLIDGFVPWSENGKHAGQPQAENKRRKNFDSRQGGGGKHFQESKHDRNAAGEPYTMRNKRSVWTVPTTAYPESHFATFPPDLIRPCILAGTKPGDIVLDPFGGSGTTGQVALEYGRRAILIELNPDYLKFCEQRTQTQGLAI